MGEQAGSTKSSKAILIRAPLAPVAVALACGTVAGRFAPLPVGLWVVLGAAGLLTAIGTFRWDHLRLLSGLAVALTIFCLAAVRSNRAYFSISTSDIVTYSDQRAVLATLRGQVADTPRIEEDQGFPAIGYRRPPVTRFVLQAEGISTRSGWRDVSGMVAVTIRQRDDRLRAGQRVELAGWLARIEGGDNPGQYDWSQHARRLGIWTILTVPSAQSVGLLSDERSAWARATSRLRAAAREHLAGCGDLESGQLLNALIIGERHPVLRSLNRIMMRAGVAHYLSISGAHLGVFLGFVYLICRIFALTPRRSAIAVLVVLGTYMVLAEPNPPLLRSAIMATAICLATIFRRPYSALNALAAALVVLLAAWPMDIFDAGFQLSFGIVTGLILLLRPTRRWLFGRWMKRRGLMVFRGSDRLRRWLYHTAAEWLIDATTMAIVAYTVSIPLVAYHFGFFSPYAAPLSELLAAPILAVLVPGYMSMALAAPMPNLSYAIGRLADRAAEALAWMVRAMSDLPGLSFQLRPVEIWWVILCYAVLTLAVLHRRLRLGRVVLAAALVILAAATMYTQRTAPAPPTAELNILSVGGGQCAVLRCPNGKTFLLDAGSRSGMDVYEQALWPFLRYQRLPAPEVAFVSHANTDHYNAIPEFLQHHSLRRVYVNDAFGSQENKLDSTHPLGEDFLHVLQDRRVPLLRLRGGDVVNLDERTSIRVLWPPRGTTNLPVNDSSLVLLVTCDDTSILLPGDIEENAQRSLVAEGLLPHADALIVPHHGGWKTSLPGFLAAVNPRYVVVSTSREPTGPADEEQAGLFYQRLRNSYRFYSTVRNGWIRILLGRGEIHVDSMRE